MPIHFIFRLLTGLLGVCLLSACSESGSDDAEAISPPNGFFIDSGVKGLNYLSSSYSGVTGANGSFPYAAGESTTFSLYGLNLGSANPTSDNPVVTPASLLGEGRTAAQMQTLLGDRASDSTAQAITNLLVLLQSFDEDGEPENGISIRDASITGTDDDYSNLLQSLDLNSANFRTDAEVLLQSNVFYSQRSLVAEADAIEHFIASLENLETVTEYVGRWNMRSGDHGDVSAVYSFTDGGSVSVIDYENCPDDLWGSSEGLLKSNCAPVALEQTFSSNGASISLISSDFTDTCLPISISSHEATLACDFFGSGLGTEVIRLQRAPTDFSQAPLLGTYHDLNAGSGVGSFTVNENNTGSYEDSGTVAFVWTKTDTVLNVNPSPADTAVDLTFKGYIKGSWLIEEEGGTGVNMILRNPENVTDANLLKQGGGFFGRFDVTPTALESSGSGQCKGVARFTDDGMSTTTFDRYDNASGNTYSCDYPRDWDEQTPVSDTVVFSTNAMTITGNSEDLDCYLLGMDEYELNSYYVACEKTGRGSFDIEIWKPL